MADKKEKDTYGAVNAWARSWRGQDFARRVLNRRDRQGRYLPKLDPEKGVISTNYIERSLGRLVSVPLDAKPFGWSDVDLAVDLFWAYFQDGPEPYDSIPVERRINAELLSWLTSSPVFEQTRLTTKGNVPASVAAAQKTWYNLWNDKSVQQAMSAQRQADEMMEKAADLIRSAGIYGSGEDQQDKSLGQMIRDLLDKDKEKQGAQQPNQRQAGAQRQKTRQQIAEQNRQAASVMQSEAEQMVKEQLEAIQKGKSSYQGEKAMAARLQSAQETAEKVDEACTFWGIESGNLSAFDVEELESVLELAKSKVFKDFARSVGRAKGLAKSSIEAVVRNPAGSQVKVVMTRDIPRIFAYDRIFLQGSANKVLRTKKMIQYIRTGLPGWERRGAAEKQGHMVCLIDDSGSMDGWERRVARSCSLGIAMAMKENQGRHWTMSLFSADNDPLITVRDTDDWKALVSWSTAVLGNGTSFTRPIQFGIEEVKRMAANHIMGTDIVFITDGEGPISQDSIAEIKKLKEETGLRLHYVLLASRNWTNKDLEALADTISWIKTPDEAEKMVTQIVSNMTDRERAKQIENM